MWIFDCVEVGDPNPCITQRLTAYPFLNLKHLDASFTFTFILIFLYEESFK